MPRQNKLFKILTEMALQILDGNLQVLRTVKQRMIQLYLLNFRAIKRKFFLPTYLV